MSWPKNKRPTQFCAAAATGNALRVSSCIYVGMQRQVHTKPTQLATFWHSWNPKEREAFRRRYVTIGATEHVVNSAYTDSGGLQQRQLEYSRVAVVLKCTVPWLWHYIHNYKSISTLPPVLQSLVPPIFILTLHRKGKKSTHHELPSALLIFKISVDWMLQIQKL